MFEQADSLVLLWSHRKQIPCQFQCKKEQKSALK